MATPTKIAALAASDRLATALTDLVHRGILPHCGDPSTGWMWLSEQVEDRAKATKLCIGCPIYRECGAAASARREQFGVWSGQDRTRNAGKPGRPRKPGRRHRRASPP
jgi:hypothetical protein